MHGQQSIKNIPQTPFGKNSWPSSGSNGQCGNVCGRSGFYTSLS